MTRIVPSLLISLVLAATGRPALAATMQFASSGQFQVQAKGAPDPMARVFRSALPPWQFLVMTSAYPRPVLVTTGPVGARMIDPKRVTPDPADAQVMQLDTSGPVEDLLTISFEGPNLVLDRDGVVVTLAPTPPVLGSKTLPELLVAIPEYKRNAANYTPDAAAVAQLRAEKEPAELMVVFGSWCSHCEAILPKLIRVLEDAKPPGLKVTFHGVAPGRTKDTVADELRITGLPTGVVSRDGKEVARITDEDWDSPEKSLVAVLNGKPTH
ncbi:MAG TPA: thioredoxin family protein [Candidatus Binatia bacterium]|jgi:thiol-disulfide isomerase/thioredoxin|nr:thioredoxin family protein [Candidatus Binatia bacterium]